MAALSAAAAAMPQREQLQPEQACVVSATARGYFFPDEEELIRVRYLQYLALRAALVEILADLEDAIARAALDWRRWQEHLPLFTVAFAAACLLDRADRYVISLASERPPVWKKLDEEDPRAGLPRKTFTAIYRHHTDPSRRARMLLAIEFHRRHREAIRSLEADATVGAAARLLRQAEAGLDAHVTSALRQRLAYRLFSFLRRQRSAWKQTMFGFFEASGRTVSELRIPGVKPEGAPKRLSGELRERVLEHLQPGDVVVTRHDDAMTNWFLPGFWPHAALYLGTRDELEGVAEPGVISCAGPWFLEAKKDGVKIRPTGETLQVDALLLLRPRLGRDEVRQALARALTHSGKPYDYLFDFRTADRLVCTEVVYRAYHGVGGLRFELRDVGGRLCLPAEEFLTQSLGGGFELVAAAGLRGEVLLSGSEALQALAETRPEVARG